MTKNPTESTLVYTIGIIKFPRIPGIERFTDSFHDGIRSDYPLPDECKISVLNANFQPEGVQFTGSENPVWQFRSIDQHWAFILTDRSLGLHTVGNHNFSEFSDRLKKGLMTIPDIPEIGMEWMTGIGIRYIYRTANESDKKISEYIHPRILPSNSPQRALTPLEGAYVTRYKTNEGELRLQTLFNPGSVLPPELQSPLITKNGWFKDDPGNNFTVIDIDHSVTFTPPKEANALQTLETLSDLQKTSRLVFESVGIEPPLTSGIKT